MLIDLEFVGVFRGGVNETEVSAERQTNGDVAFVLFSRDLKYLNCGDFQSREK
jgi:hypothetical protein